MPLRLVTAPVADPVTVGDTKDRIRIDHDFHDLQLRSLIKAATQEIDGEHGWLGRALLTQQWDWIIDGLPECGVELPLPPLQSVDSIKYLDSAGITQTVNPNSYEIINRGDQRSRVQPKPGLDWPPDVAGTRWGWEVYFGPEVRDWVTIRFTAGWLTRELIPDQIKVWLYARVGAMYMQPEAITCGGTGGSGPSQTVPMYQHYLNSYRIWTADQPSQRLPWHVV